jgi:superfamily II DNA or RNA helicase
VASKHKEAQTFLRKGFFEGLKSFREFEARTEKLANTKEVGDALEILVEAHLHLDQVLKAKNVWVVGDIPLKIRKSLNLPADSKGIDGVYEDASGHIIPYQVKYRTDKDTLPYGEVSSFLGITEESLKDRVIFTNARNLAADITKRKGLRSFKAAQFHSLTEEDFNRIYAWLSDKKPAFKRWSPQTHQKEAIEKITAALKVGDRTTAVMACGTGKTLVALWAAEAQEPKTVLVLVPSLALLSQTLPDWCKQTSWGERFRYLCVCSDASVDRSAKEDEYALKQSDIEFPVTTDPKLVKGFLDSNKDGVNVIFSTYQSAEVVAEGLKGQTVDLGIFDEAHKTTGDKKGLFAFGLSDKNIRIRKRLFLTATPRHYKLNKRDKDGDFQVVSMNDDTVYGKVSYRLPFSTAVAAGIIVPYKVIISVSLNKEVDAELLRRGSTRVRRDEIQAKWVANQIALKRAIQKTGASKIITFHSRVNLAEDFAGDSTRGFQEHVKGFDVFHVNGSQNAADRKALLEGFKTAPKGLITNARCLTEGVDVPAVDMVAFVDPRKSKIDIAQAAGRAMRQSKATNKKLGYIVVPLFIEQKKGETEAEAFTRAGFDEVAEVLGAMLESDDDLIDTIKELQEARGRGDKFNPRQLHEKIEVIGPAINLDKLTQSIGVEILDRLGLSWDRWFGLLQNFNKREGNCRVPQSHLEYGMKLGAWVGNIRQGAIRLSEEQKCQLDAIGFSWDPHAEQWEKRFATLQTFRKREGHCRASRSHIENQFNLGKWLNSLRSHKSDLSSEQISRLDSIGFSWDPRTEQWEECFAALEKFHKKEGHARVNQTLRTGHIKLGYWTNIQRQLKKKGELTQERIGRLDSLGFCWDPRADQWEEAYTALQKFQNKEGHCNVPTEVVLDGIKLRGWVNMQRSRKHRLTPTHIKRLEALGFSFDPHSEQWEEAFAALQKFRKKEGHCLVSRATLVGDVKLGSWVNTQRMKKNRLTPDRIRRLDTLGFSWDARTNQWEEAFIALKKLWGKEGHSNVDKDIVAGGMKLASWVVRQRQFKNKGLLTPTQIRRLNTIGFSWDPYSEKWEEAFSALQKFHKREGHCKVPDNHFENELQIGSWATTQRRLKKDGKLAPDRISRMNSIGFVWDVLSEQWEKAFSASINFHKREGHWNIPDSHIEDELKIGLWTGVQRMAKRKGRLTPDRLRRLNELGFTWNLRADKWEAAFTTLQKFRKDEGHCRAPQGLHVDGINLGYWINSQRVRKNKGQLSPDRVQRLDSIGFSWDPHSEQWEGAFAVLEKFRKREGHCRVSSTLEFDGLKLGVWVGTQRQNKAALTPARIKRLNSLGFIWKT